MHLIRCQILELELPREAGAVALQRRASRVFQEQVLPRLDEVFSRIAPPDRLVRIKRLELDLGDISEASWERDFIEKCVTQISQQVVEAAFAVGGEHPTETLNAEENVLTVFQYFLETGMLPWYAKHLTLKALQEMVSKAIASGRAFRSEELRRILKEKPDALQRLIWQFSTAFSEKMVETAMDLSQGWVQQAIQIRQSQTGQKMTGRAFFQLATHLLNADNAVLENTPPTAALLAQLFFAENPSDAIPPYSISSSAPKQVSENLLPSAAEEVPTRPTLPQPKNTPEETSEGLPQANGSDPEQVVERPRPSAEKKPVDKKVPRLKPDPMGIQVDTAGLVLLAVYLPPFFKKLEIELESPITDHQLTSHPFRAVQLLHFLATGQEKPEEPMLVLPKILCGLSLETPVPQHLDLSAEEKIEANRLLEAIVRNWSVLKNTSPDGLRAGFIQRPGLLSWSDSRESWVLRVERLGQDMLLEKLPWSYSVIKLPWMGEMLSVEW